MIQNLLVQTHINLYGKNSDFRLACLSGLVTGLTVQLELLKNGVRYYDGSMVHVLKINSGRPICAVLRDLGDWENLLSTGLFVDWEYANSDLSSVYFANIGSGAIYVSQLVNELVSLGRMTDQEATLVAERIVLNIIGELNKLF